MKLELDHGGTLGGLRRWRVRIYRLRMLGRGFALCIDTPWWWCDVIVTHGKTR